MFYESLIILNISTLNFSEGVPASVLDCRTETHTRIIFYKQRFLGLVKFLKKLSNRTSFFENLKQHQENY